MNGGADGVVVKAAVRPQVRLPVGDPVLRQGAGAGPDADDLLEGVVGQPHRREELVPRQKVGGQGHGQRMGAAGDLGPHQGGLGVKNVGVDPLQPLPAVVVVAVARGGGEVVGPHPVFLHGGEDLGLV